MFIIKATKERYLQTHITMISLNSRGAPTTTTTMISTGLDFIRCHAFVHWISMEIVIEVRWCARTRTLMQNDKRAFLPAPGICVDSHRHIHMVCPCILRDDCCVFPWICMMMRACNMTFPTVCCVAYVDISWICAVDTFFRASFCFRFLIQRPWVNVCDCVVALRNHDGYFFSLYDI